MELVVAECSMVVGQGWEGTKVRTGTSTAITTITLCCGKATDIAA